MRRVSRRTIAIVLSVLFVTSVVAMPVLAAPMDVGEPRQATATDAEPVGTSEDRRASTSGTIHVHSSVRQVDRVGEYGVTSAVTIPDQVSEFRIQLPERARNVSADGFRHEDAQTWEWDERTDDPQLTYRMPANRTTDESGPLETGGNYIFVDTGSWAIIQPPRVGRGIGGSWRALSETRMTGETVIEGSGTIGSSMAYLGPYEEYTHEASGQRFRLIVPENAELDESPDSIFDSLEHASRALQVGDRDPEVFVIAAPTENVGWGVKGLQTGPADMWVRDVERLDTGDNVWVHEYVHTRQAYAQESHSEPSAEWTVEAMATYYAALLTLERGEIDFEEFQRVLRRGEREPQAAAILADPESWENNANYWKGGLAAGEIDRRIRLATDSERTLATVFRDLNAKDGTVSNDDLLRFIENAAGSDVRTDTRRLTTTREHPSAWNRSVHDEAFGQLPARIGFSIADPDAVRATGDYRDRRVDRDPVRLVPGETLQIAVSVSNTGGVTGEYDLTMRVNGTGINDRQGRIGAEETTTETFTHTVTEPGTYEVNVGGERLTVTVVEPALVDIRSLSVDRDQVSTGETVTVTASVENRAVTPADGDLTLETNGQPAETRTVRLDADGETTVEFEVTVNDPGETTLSIGDQQVTVTVADGSTSPTESTNERTPGFGVGVAAIAVVSAALLTHRQ